MANSETGATALLKSQSGTDTEQNTQLVAAPVTQADLDDLHKEMEQLGALPQIGFDVKDLMKHPMNSYHDAKNLHRYIVCRSRKVPVPVMHAHCCVRVIRVRLAAVENYKQYVDMMVFGCKYEEQLFRRVIMRALSEIFVEDSRVHVITEQQSIVFYESGFPEYCDGTSYCNRLWHTAVSRRDFPAGFKYVEPISHQLLVPEDQFYIFPEDIARPRIALIPTQRQEPVKKIKDKDYSNSVVHKVLVDTHHAQYCMPICVARTKLSKHVVARVAEEHEEFQMAEFTSNQLSRAVKRGPNEDRKCEMGPNPFPNLLGPCSLADKQYPLSTGGPLEWNYSERQNQMMAPQITATQITSQVVENAKNSVSDILNGPMNAVKKVTTAVDDFAHITSTVRSSMEAITKMVESTVQMIAPLASAQTLCLVASVVIQLLSFRKQRDLIQLGGIACTLAALFGISISTLTSAITALVEFFNPKKVPEGRIAQISPSDSPLPFVAVIGMFLFGGKQGDSITSRVTSAFRNMMPITTFALSTWTISSVLTMWVPTGIRAWFSALCPGFTQVDFMTRSDVQEFISRANDYTVAGYLYSKDLTSDVQAILVKDVGVMKKLHAEAVKTFGSKPVPAVFLTACRVVAQIGGLLKTRKAGTPSDAECPFFLTLFGEPGVGKSVIASDASFSIFGSEEMKLVHRNFWESSVDYEKRAAEQAKLNHIYYRAPGDKYFSRFDIFKKTILYDDLGQTNAQVTGITEFSELFGLLSATVSQLPMADVSEKGMTSSAKLIIATTNQRQLCSDEIKEARAIWRRVNMAVEVSIDPKYGVLTSLRGRNAHYMYNPNAKCGKYDQYIFQRYDMKTGGNVGEPFRWEEFTNILATEFLEWQRKQVTAASIPTELIATADRIAQKFRSEMPERYADSIVELEETFHETSSDSGRSSSNSMRNEIDGEEEEVPGTSGILNFVTSMQDRKTITRENLKKGHVVSREKCEHLLNLEFHKPDSEDDRSWYTRFIEYIFDFFEKYPNAIFMLGVLTSGLFVALIVYLFDEDPGACDTQGKLPPGQFIDAKPYNPVNILEHNRLRTIARKEVDALTEKLETSGNYDLFYAVSSALIEIDQYGSAFKPNQSFAYDQSSRPNSPKVYSVGRKTIGKKNQAEVIDSFVREYAIDAEGVGLEAIRQAVTAIRKDHAVGRRPMYIERDNQMKKKQLETLQSTEPVCHWGKTVFLNKLYSFDRDFYTDLITYMNNINAWNELDQEKHLERVSWTDENMPEEMRAYVQRIPGMENQMMGAGRMEDVNIGTYVPKTRIEHLSVAMNKLYRNVIRIDRMDETGLFGVGICRNMAMVPSHLFSVIKDGEELKITYRSATYNVIYARRDVKFVEGLDVAFWLMPHGVLPYFADIVDRFVTEANQWEVSRREAAVLSYDMMTGTPMYTYAKWARRQTNIEYTSAYLVVDGEKVHHNNICTWEIEVATAPGACGLPYIDITPTGNGRIFAIHVAADKHCASGAIVYLEMCLEALEHFKISRLQDSRLCELMCHPGEMPKFRVPNEFSVVGIAPLKQHLNQKTQYQQSIIFEKATGPHIKEPAVLSHADARVEVPDWKPLEMALEKYNHKCPTIDPTLVKEVADHVKYRMARYLNPNHARLATYDEVVNGMKNSEFSKRMNLKAGCGWPYTHFAAGQKGKHGYVNMYDKHGHLTNDPEKLERAELTPEFKEAVIAQDSVLRMGRVGMFTFCDQLKDELRPLEKIRAGKTRAFCMPDLPYIVLGRRYTLGFSTAFLESNLEDFSAVGMNPESPDWNRMMKKLLRFNDHFFDLDVSAFDGWVNSQFLMADADIMNEFYTQGSDNQAMTQIDNDVRTLLMHTIVHTPTVVMDAMYESHVGNKSGNILTTTSNTLNNYMGLLLAWRKRAPTHLRDLSNFHRYVGCIFYGDDMVVSVHPEVISWFNGKSVIEEQATFGMKLTMSDKHGEAVECRHYSQCEFLKRKTVFHKEWKIYIPLFRREEYEEMVNWVRKSDDPEQACIDNIEDSLNQAIAYGEKVYRDWWQRCYVALGMAGSIYVPTSYESMQAIFYDKYHPGEAGWGKSACNNAYDSAITQDLNEKLLQFQWPFEPCYNLLSTIDLVRPMEMLAGNMEDTSIFGEIEDCDVVETWFDPHYLDHVDIDFDAPRGPSVRWPITIDGVPVAHAASCNDDHLVGVETNPGPTNDYEINLQRSWHAKWYQLLDLHGRITCTCEICMAPILGMLDEVEEQNRLYDEKQVYMAYFTQYVKILGEKVGRQSQPGEWLEGCLRNGPTAATARGPMQIEYPQRARGAVCVARK